MLKTFRSYQISVQFYQECTALKLPRHLKDQLSRASSSVALNLAEGYGKTSFLDKKKFYTTALGSLRECQAVLDLASVKQSAIRDRVLVEEGIENIVVNPASMARSAWHFIHRPEVPGTLSIEERFFMLNKFMA